MANEVILTEFVVTCVVHTARVSDVESTVCDNKERKMVNYKEINVNFNRPMITRKEFMSRIKYYVIVTYLSGT